MPLARLCTRHSCIPPGCLRPAQPPGNQRGEDAQNDYSYQWPVIPCFHSTQKLHQQDNTTQEAERVSHNLDRTCPAHAAPYALAEKHKKEGYEPENREGNDDREFWI